MIQVQWFVPVPSTCEAGQDFEFLFVLHNKTPFPKKMLDNISVPLNSHSSLHGQYFLL
jgi:hypothetical protein